MIVIKILLFVLSTLGLWEMMHRYLKNIDISFFPGITVAVQIVLLFFAGLFNVLLEVTFIIYGIGLISIILIVFKDKNVRFLREYLKPSFCFLGISLAVMAFSLDGKTFIHYDNFSHWALVVRRIIQTNRFPNFSDSIILFQEYPIGSAIFIYFFSKLIDNKESIQMLAQVYMMLVSIIPLLSLGKKGWPFIVLLVATFTNYILVYNIAVTDLLVDTLLPLVSMSGLLYTMQYCKKTEQKRNTLPIAFYLMQIVQIKNSGMFFAGFIVVVLIIYPIKNKAIYFAIIASPFVSFFLWHKHCQYVFGASELSKHAMTPDNYKKVFKTKSLEEIILIRNSMIKWIVNWKDLWLTIGILLLLVFLVFVLHREGARKSLGIILVAVFLFATYQVGIYFMYLFSMPSEEALNLSGIERYEKTIIISMLYLLLVPIINIVYDDRSKKRVKSVILTSIMIIAIFTHMGVSNGKITFVAAKVLQSTSSKKRSWVESVKQEYSIPDGDSYTMLIPELDYGYAHYICKYVFQSNSIDTLIVKSEEDMNSINTKYILVYDTNEIAQQWIKKHFPNQVGQSVIIR